MRATKPETDAKVRQVLAASALPKSVVQITRATGLSYNTVAVTLERIGAIKVSGVYPATWTDDLDKIKGQGMPVVPGERIQLVEPALPRINDKRDMDVVVGIVTSDEWVKRYNKAIGGLGRTMLDSEIKPDADPKELLIQFQALAYSFASITYALSNVQDMPDWYQALGGGT